MVGHCSHGFTGKALPSRRQAGFTLLELLVVMAVMAILISIGTLGLRRWQNNLNAENFVQNFAAQMNLARTQTLSTGVVYRLNLTSASSFQVEQQNSTNGSWSVARGPFTNTSVTFSTSGARLFQFDSRGSMTAFTAGGAQTLNTNLTVTLPKGTSRTILITALGLTRGV